MIPKLGKYQTIVEFRAISQLLYIKYMREVSDYQIEAHQFGFREKYSIGLLMLYLKRLKKINFVLRYS